MISDRAQMVFIVAAMRQRVARTSLHAILALGHKSAFCFPYDTGDLFTMCDPQHVMNLVMFARNFAVENTSVGYHERSSCYGLLNMAVEERQIWRNCEIVFFSTIGYGLPGHTSLKDYLAQNGYLVPEYIEDPAPIDQVIAGARQNIEI